MNNMRTDVPWVGVLLAGGCSRRMGRDKAGLTWRGRPLLQHQRDLLLAAGASRVVVSGDYPQAQGIPDAVPDQGPLGGLLAVSAVLEDGPLVVLPIDMPQIPPALLAALARAPARCAHYRGHVLPLRLPLDAALRAWLAQSLRHPPELRSLRALHAVCGGTTLPLPPDEAHLLVNCNTPGEWEALAP
jgi:molybdopterin-guanine dinucleotide biosynthesis protein A